MILEKISDSELAIDQTKLTASLESPATGRNFSVHSAPIDQSIVLLPGKFFNFHGYIDGYSHLSFLNHPI